LLADVVFTYPNRLPGVNGCLSCRDAKGREWVFLTTHTKTLRAGYRWNGNSPKIGVNLAGKELWLGTPDFTRTAAASLGHDADYQFLYIPHFPIPRSLADLGYYHLAVQHKFALASVYYTALNYFGGAWRGTAPQPGLSCHLVSG
jgi:hypothetical protein